MELLPILFLGLMMGVQHAFDPDHVAAIVSLSTKTKSLKQSLPRGIVWGIGHTLAILAIGLLVLLFNIAIPESFSLLFETMVGLALIALGVSIILEVVKERIHTHAHIHGGVKHAHFHSHEDAGTHDHYHGSPALIKPLVVGTLHGLAGSAALMLLVLSATDSFSSGFLYIIIFGLGSIIGMVIITSTVSLPFVITSDIYKNFHQLIGISSAIISIVFGVFYIAGLFF